MNIELTVHLFNCSVLKSFGTYRLKKQETSMQILEAASKRFMHYGYNKTTMAEIARDLKMSTGNLYRFFPSKLDIAEAIAVAHEEDDYKLLSHITELKKPAPERLRIFVQNVLEVTFYKIAESNKVFEVAQAIISQRPEYANKVLANEREFLIKILNDGVEEGTIKPLADANWTAEVLQCATMKYRYPQLHHCYNLDYLKKELDGVMDHFNAGIGAK